MMSIVHISALLLAGFLPPYLTRTHKALTLAGVLCFVAILALGGVMTRVPTEDADGPDSIFAPLVLLPSLIGFLSGVSARLIALHYNETRIFGRIGLRAGAVALTIAIAAVFVPLKILFG